MHRFTRISARRPGAPTATALLALAAAASSLSFEAAARAGDWVDTRITFTMGDDNFRRDAGETVPDSPKFGIGDRGGYELAFDNLDQKYTGRENLLHLALYKKVAGLLPGLTTEANAAVKLDLAAMMDANPVLSQVLMDDSSYIRLSYAIDREKRGTKWLDLVFFPLSGDRFRIGYLYTMTWAGADMFPKKKGLTPAFKLGGNHGRFYWWAGMKMVQVPTAPVVGSNEQQTRIENSTFDTVYSALGGIGGQPVDGLSLDLSGGFVQQGYNPVEDVRGQPITASGFSARVAYGRGLDVALSSDLRLIRNDPEYIESLSTRPRYKNDNSVNWRIALEGNAIAQTLKDPDLYGGTTLQWASAAALDVRFQRNFLRLNLTAVYRSLQFSLLTTPSFVPYVAFSKEMIVQPQIFGAIAADYYFPRVALTPGLQTGIEIPAAVKTELYQVLGQDAPATLLGTHSLLVRKSGERVILPEDEDRLPVFSVRVTFKWYPSDFLTLMAFFQLVYDQNASILTLNVDSSKTRVFDTPTSIGAGIIAQARY
jgi:hypothetical protein